MASSNTLHHHYHHSQWPLKNERELVLTIALLNDSPVTITHFTVLLLLCKRVCVRPCECFSVLILPYTVSLCFFVVFGLIQFTWYGFTSVCLCRNMFAVLFQNATYLIVLSVCLVYFALHFYFFFFSHKNSYLFCLLFNFTDFSFYEIKCISFHSVFAQCLNYVFTQTHNCIVVY